MEVAAAVLQSGVVVYRLRFCTASVAWQLPSC
jgi:hypothetical protein